jgi:hypothetical protein
MKNKAGILQAMQLRQKESRSAMIQIEELLQNKTIKTSLARVAEYLLDVVVEKCSEKQARFVPTSEKTTPSVQGYEEEDPPKLP